MKWFVAVLLALLVAALLVLLWLGFSVDDETRLLVRMQTAPETPQAQAPAECGADALDSAVAEALTSAGVSMAAINALEQLPRRQARALVRHVMDCRPWSLGDGQVRLSGAILSAWLTSAPLARLNRVAHQACYSFRWESASFVTVAAECGRVLSGWSGRWAASAAPKTAGLRLGEQDQYLQEANLDTLIQPFDAQPLIALILRLDRAGYSTVAEHLRSEVMQIHPDAATGLENATARRSQYLNSEKDRPHGSGLSLADPDVSTCESGHYVILQSGSAE